MANPLFKKLRGFYKAERDRFNLLNDSKFKLTTEEFVLLDLYVAITDWDKKHLDTYGTFQARDKDIAEIINWKSSTTVNRWRRILENKGLVCRKPENRYAVIGFDKRNLPKSEAQEKVAELHSEYTEIDTVVAKITSSNAEMHVVQVQPDDYPLVSFKGEFNGFPSEQFNDDEIERISAAIDAQELASNSVRVQENSGVDYET